MMLRPLLVLILALAIGIETHNILASESKAPEHGQALQATPGSSLSYENKSLESSTRPGGYSANQVRAYLKLTGNGAGQTLAIIAAFDHPNIVDDVNIFSEAFGLPPVCHTTGAKGSNCFNLIKVTPNGKPVLNPWWAREISSGVEWAHAIAP